MSATFAIATSSAQLAIMLRSFPGVVHCVSGQFAHVAERHRRAGRVLGVVAIN